MAIMEVIKMDDYTGELPTRIGIIHDISTLRGYLLNKDVLPDEFVSALINVLDYASEKTTAEAGDYFKSF